MKKILLVAMLIFSAYSHGVLIYDKDPRSTIIYGGKPSGPTRINRDGFGGATIHNPDGTTNRVTTDSLTGDVTIWDY